MKKESHYIKDKEIASLWTIANLSNLENDFLEADSIDISCLAPVGDDITSRCNDSLKQLLELEEKSKTPLPKLSLYIDVTSYEEIGLPIKDEAFEYCSNETKKEVEQAEQKVMNNQATSDDFRTILEYNHSFGYGLYFHKGKLDKKIQSKAKQKLDLYIDNFVNRELLVSNVNYLTFEEQRKRIISKILERELVKKYGNTFVVYREEKDSVTTSEREAEEQQSELFFHTLIGLEKTGYITIHRLWRDIGHLGTKWVDKATITLLREFEQDIDETFQKLNPKLIIESYNPETKILQFAGKKIEISKNMRETKETMLLETLLKKPPTSKKENEKTYWSNNEIFEDWGYIDADIDAEPENSLYHTARNLNTKIAARVQIDDLIDNGTEWFEIKEKYKN